MAKISQPELAKDIRNSQDYRTLVFKSKKNKSELAPNYYEYCRPYFRVIDDGGISPCIRGNTKMASYNEHGFSALPNCVG